MNFKIVEVCHFRKCLLNFIKPKGFKVIPTFKKLFACVVDVYIYITVKAVVAVLFSLLIQWRFTVYNPHNLIKA